MENSYIKPNFKKIVLKIPMKYQENTNKFGTEMPKTELVFWYIWYFLFGINLAQKYQKPSWYFWYIWYFLVIQNFGLPIDITSWLVPGDMVPDKTYHFAGVGNHLNVAASFLSRHFSFFRLKQNSTIR